MSPCLMPLRQLYRPMSPYLMPLRQLYRPMSPCLMPLRQLYRLSGHGTDVGDIGKNAFQGRLHKTEIPGQSKQHQNPLFSIIRTITRNFSAYDPPKRSVTYFQNAFQGRLHKIEIPGQSKPYQDLLFGIIRTVTRNFRAYDLAKITITFSLIRALRICKLAPF
ncbi:hypothetical protein AVEN_41076-1 [Araneus ventricosus]|uniref:Uncharacterized protein n=1 Tax=Araneus ventricosus TaxID=182803 RepID=A0A4Y2CIK3_ARAVE|nr:hypothetical protein AVEN_41076-1 [Araneus ventricosus]